MCGFAVIDHRSRGYNFIYESHLNLSYLKFAQGFQAASAQAQFYTQRSRIHLSTLWRQCTRSINKTKTSPVLCSCVTSKHMQTIPEDTCLFVNHIGCCSFPSQSPRGRLLKLLKTHLQSCT